MGFGDSGRLGHINSQVRSRLSKLSPLSRQPIKPTPACSSLVPAPCLTSYLSCFTPRSPPSHPHRYREPLVLGVRRGHQLPDLKSKRPPGGLA